MEERVILFCDVHCFSRVMNALGDTTPAFVQRYYETAGRAVVAHGGKLLKYMGDAILAVFPEGHEQDAVRAALAMRKDFPAVVPRLSPPVQTELEVSVGSGPVHTGEFGHESLRMEDVFGETVNETAVIMHTRGIAITRAVRDAVGGLVESERRPDVHPKWRAEPLESWRVVEKA
jgi:adenylate cyclase